MNKKHLMSGIVDTAKAFVQGFSGTNPTREWFGALGFSLLIVIVGGVYAWQATSSLSSDHNNVVIDSPKKLFLYDEAKEIVNQYDEYRARFELLSETQGSGIEVYVGEEVPVSSASSADDSKVPVADTALIQVE